MFYLTFCSVLFLRLSWIVFSTVSVPFFFFFCLDSNVFIQLLCGLIFGLKVGQMWLVDLDIELFYSQDVR